MKTEKKNTRGTPSSTREMRAAVAHLDSVLKDRAESSDEAPPNSCNSLAVWRTKMNLTSVKASRAIRRVMRRA
jgi:hypothetical protein